MSAALDKFTGNESLPGDWNSAERNRCGFRANTGVVPGSKRPARTIPRERALACFDPSGVICSQQRPVFFAMRPS
jgi:hypothetical protein